METVDAHNRVRIQHPAETTAEREIDPVGRSRHGRALPETPSFSVRLSEQDGISAQTERKDIIGCESAGVDPIAEIVLEAQFEVRDSWEIRTEHSAGDWYRIFPPRTSAIVRWITGSGQWKILRVCYGEA